MISYLGVPLLFPNGNPFGTICVLDNKEHAYSNNHKKLLLNFREIIEGHLELLYMNKALGEKNNHLSDYIAEIQALREFIPICSSCKSIRDDAGYWNKVEAYMNKHAGMSFTHSLCPKCAEKLYPDFYKKPT